MLYTETSYYLLVGFIIDHGVGYIKRQDVAMSRGQQQSGG